MFSFYGYKRSVAFCNSTIGANFLNIVGGSGAPSSLYSKPSWQTGILGVPSDGKRDLPDVSLFASNGFWQHLILFCMSDAAQGGAPCDYTNGTDTLFNSAGGTSFTAPQFASIQALINQKAGNCRVIPIRSFTSWRRPNTEALPHPNKKICTTAMHLEETACRRAAFSMMSLLEIMLFRAAVPLTVTILRLVGTKYWLRRICIDRSVSRD